MGEDIPELPPGDEKSVFDCLACYAADEMPKYLRITFVGVTLCPGFFWPGGVDLNRTWWITSYENCRWQYLDANWWIGYFAAGPFDAIAFAVPNGGLGYFDKANEPPCTAFFVNGYQLPCIFTNGAWGGTAAIT